MARPSQRQRMSATTSGTAPSRSIVFGARQHGTVELLRQLRECPCGDCGSMFAPHRMDFDHREGTSKRFRLTSGGAMLRPTTAILDEAAKCGAVCANCHRIRTQRRHAARVTPIRGTSRQLGRKRATWRGQARLLDELCDVPCLDCGGRFPPCAMDFDHREGESKRSAVTRMIGRRRHAAHLGGGREVRYHLRELSSAPNLPAKVCRSGAGVTLSWSSDCLPSSMSRVRTRLPLHPSGPCAQCRLSPA